MTSEWRVIASTLLAAAALVTVSGCSSATTEPPRTDTQRVEDEPRQDPEGSVVHLDGLVVSIETSDTPFGEHHPSDVDTRPGHSVVYARLVAQNSTETTITDVRVDLNWPSASYANGDLVESCGNSVVSEGGVLSGRVRSLPQQKPAFAPGAALTAWSAFEIESGRELIITWEFSPERVAKFSIP